MQEGKFKVYICYEARQKRMSILANKKTTTNQRSLIDKSYGQGYLQLQYALQFSPEVSLQLLNVHVILKVNIQTYCSLS